MAAFNYLCIPCTTLFYTCVQSSVTVFVMLYSKIKHAILFLISLIGGDSGYKLIYRHYATLYFVFCVDASESELGILDLIQVQFIPQKLLQ